MQIELTWLLPDGRAGGRSPDGRMARVRGALVGDVVEADLPSGGRAADVEVWSLVRPSPARQPAACPRSEVCGGCDLDQLAPDAREDALRRSVAHAFGWEGPVSFFRSPRPVAHRARIKLAIERGQLGYMGARSHAHTPVDVCRIAREEVQEAHARLQAWLDAEPSRANGLSSVEIRSDGARAVYAFESDGPADVAALRALGDVALDGRAVAGDPTLRFQHGGVTLRASPSAFYQVNLEVNTALSAAVAEAVREAQLERVLDLYAGIGNLGLPLAARGTRVVAVEAPGPGATDLAANAKDLDLAEVIAARVEKLDPSRVAFDGVVLDPPRAGAPGVLQRVSRNRPRRIVYVSCHAPSAARDVRELPGYRITSVSAFEMFPETHHVEAIVVLDRG